MVNVLNVAGAAAIIYLVVILGQTITKNYTLNKQVSDLQEQITQLQDQKDTLAYNIEYYKTKSYQEREARAKLGLQMPDETVVILPAPKVAPTPVPESPTTAIKKKSNFAQWVDFLSGKS